MENPHLNSALKTWLPLALTTIVLSALVYTVVQQSYRMSANDPQIQIAEDIATVLSQGNTAPDSVVPPNPTTDISASLSTFVVIYSATGTPIGSSVALDGKLPTIPAGVIDYTKNHNQDRFTWQPKTGTRIAAVMTKFAGPTPGYILAGRSLREVEKRETQLLILTAIATLFSLLLTFLACWLLSKQSTGPNIAMVEISQTENITILPEEKI